MPRRPIAHSAACMLALGLGMLSNTAAAVPCALGGLAGTEVRRGMQGEVVELPARELAQCDGLVVMKGEAIACTTDIRGRGQCQAFAQGITISADRLNRNGPVKGAWTTFVELIKGSPGHASAVSRGPGDEAPLPNGPVMLLHPLKVDFAAHPSLQGNSAIRVHEGGPNGPLVATLGPQHGTTSLPSERLKPGTTYWWQVVSDEATLPQGGRFNLLSAAERKQARTEYARVQRMAPKSPNAQAAMWASWLAEQGLESEAKVVLRSARVGGND